jgi:hypothetical protein
VTTTKCAGRASFHKTGAPRDRPRIELCGFGRLQNRPQRCDGNPEVLLICLKRLVGERGFEPPTPWSRTRFQGLLKSVPNMPSLLFMIRSATELRTRSGAPSAGWAGHCNQPRTGRPPGYASNASSSVRPALCSRRTSRCSKRALVLRYVTAAIVPTWFARRSSESASRATASACRGSRASCS